MVRPGDLRPKIPTPEIAMRFARFSRIESCAVRTCIGLLPRPFASTTAAWLLLTLAAVAHADDAIDASASSAVRREILARDAQLSDAYNRCKIATLKRMFDDDAELYFSGRGATDRIDEHTDEVRREFCGRFRRDSDPDTQAIYALPGHIGAVDGAIQIGAQSFCVVGETPCRGAHMRFAAVWRRIDGEWKISRLIRYGYDATP
jgi:Domain of unknown function (DUF4440)